MQFCDHLGQPQSQRKSNPKQNRTALPSDPNCKTGVLAKKAHRTHYKLVMGYYREWTQIKISQRKKHGVESGEALNTEFPFSSPFGVLRHYFPGVSMCNDTLNFSIGNWGSTPQDSALGLSCLLVFHLLPGWSQSPKPYPTSHCWSFCPGQPPA